ncbi:hypothetical protein VTK73DRAFT_7785 [Phialemonium thermophilum]|uniref:Transmembrane protein n=1 Tax=Phialemonium thermophilum TaxID=223376 RepID=A0ABR3WCX2_9PEZI
MREAVNPARWSPENASDMNAKRPFTTSQSSLAKSAGSALFESEEPRSSPSDSMTSIAGAQGPGSQEGKEDKGEKRRFFFRRKPRSGRDLESSPSQGSPSDPVPDVGPRKFGALAALNIACLEGHIEVLERSLGTLLAEGFSPEGHKRLGIPSVPGENPSLESLLRYARAIDGAYNRERLQARRRDAARREKSESVGEESELVGEAEAAEPRDDGTETRIEEEKERARERRADDARLEEFQFCLSELDAYLNKYDNAVLQYRQVQALPEAESHSFGEQQDPIPQQGARPGHKIWPGRDKFISFDPCRCPPECPPLPPAGIQRLLALPSPSDTGTYFGKIFLILLLAALPTASILVLYAIPSTYGRIGFIVGESAVVIASIAAYGPVRALHRERQGGQSRQPHENRRRLAKAREALEKAQEKLVEYMLGLAAIQVVFVGTVLSSG